MSAEKEWLVSDKTCKGCQYYGFLNQYRTGPNRCCLYTYYTGEVRKNPPKTCEVKVKGKRLRANYNTGTCNPDQKRLPTR